MSFISKALKIYVYTGEQASNLQWIALIQMRLEKKEGA